MTVDLFEELFGQPEETGTSAQDRAARAKVAEEDIRLRDLGAITIDDVFNGDDIDLDKLTAKLDDLIELDCEKKDAKPTDMIRIVHNGQVMWLSQEQARVYLDGHTDPDSEEAMIQRDIKRALKGNTRLLRQEMQTLIAMSLSSLQSYLEGEQVDAKQAQKTEQQLRRKWQDTSQQIVGMTAAEDHMKELRQKNPQLDAFEALLGEFLNARQTGDTEKVERLQYELSNLQRTYLIMARVLDPDTKALQQHRLDLQKSKKFILNLEKDLAAERRDILKMEVKKMQKHLRALKTEIASDEGPSDELKMTSHLDIEEARATGDIEQIKDVGAVEQMLEEAKAEIDVAHMKYRVSKAQEKRADKVIDYFETEIVGKDSTDSRVSDQVNRQQVKEKTSKAPPLKLDSSGQSRMVNRH